MAWHGAAVNRSHQRRAADFLLSVAGRPYENGNDYTGHDTTLIGWPWIDRTHSWVEPSSLALMALELVGNGGHARAREARRMLFDRQLERGGWNYGNTNLFGGKDLYPMPSSTGLALCALAGRTDRETVIKSLSYLSDVFSTLNTPLSLSLLLLALLGERGPLDLIGRKGKSHGVKK